METAFEDERRKEPRIEVNWPVKIFLGAGILDAEAKNISSGGIYLNCEEGLRLGDAVSMSISVPDHGPIRVAGKVLWSDFYGMDYKDHPVCLGLSFVELGDQDRSVLNDLISSRLK